MKKKILFIITYLEMGGAQTQLLHLVKNLDPREYEVHICAGRQGYLADDFSQVEGLTLYCVPHLVRCIHPWCDFMAFFELYRYIRHHTFDIVHVHCPKASMLGRWAAYVAGIKNIVYTVHGWPFHAHMNCAAYFLYKFMEKLTARITKKIIVVSQYDRDRGIAGLIAPPDKFSLIHYGIDVEGFQRACRESVAPHCPTVVTVSSFKPQKGMFYFLAAAKDILKVYPDLRFIVIGDGPDRRRFEDAVRKNRMDKSVFVTGWQSDISVFFRQASLFVLASLWEGLPVSLIEAVVAGIPVVVTDTGGVRDIVTSGQQGIIVPRVDVSVLKAACMNILRDHESWRTIVSLHRKEIDSEYWSAARMMRGVSCVYSTL